MVSQDQVTSINRPFPGMFSDANDPKVPARNPDDLKPVTYQYSIRDMTQPGRSDLLQNRIRLTYKSPTTLEAQIFSYASTGSTTYQVDLNPETKTYTASSPTKTFYLGRCAGNTSIQSLVLSHHGVTTAGRSSQFLFDYTQCQGNVETTSLETKNFIDPALVYSTTYGSTNSSGVVALPTEIQYENSKDGLIATARVLDDVQKYKITIDQNGRVIAERVNPNSMKPMAGTPMKALGFLPSNVSLDEIPNDQTKEEIVRTLSRRLTLSIARSYHLQINDTGMFAGEQVVRMGTPNESTTQPALLPDMPGITVSPKDESSTVKPDAPVEIRTQSAQDTLSTFSPTFKKWRYLATKEDRSADEVFKMIKSFYGEMGWYRKVLEKSDPNPNAKRWLNELAAIYKLGKVPQDPEMYKSYVDAAKYFKDLNDDRKKRRL